MTQPKRKKVVKKVTSQKNSTGVHSTKKRVRRRIKKPVLYGFLAIVVLIVALLTIPKTIQNNQLKELGYDKATITEIRNQKLTNLIIKNKYYSENLASSILNKSLNKDYIELYTVADECAEREFVLYDRLLDNGYTKEQVLSLFDDLSFYAITPLLVFDFQTDLAPYIADAIANKDNISATNFSLSNTYIEPYKTTYPTYNAGSYDMLVNKTYYLDSTYVPGSITDLSIQVASEGLQLESVAADALKQLCDAGRNMGLRLYASSAYRPYEHQQSLYDRYVARDGIEKADTFSARPGFSEHQTGLTVDMSAVGDGSGLAKFEETDEFVWLSQNCQEYGWILRYPSGKEQITGYTYEPWHYRYIGPDLAKKVVASGLTYDEYYLLYLAPWKNTDGETKKNAPVETAAPEETTPAAESPQPTATTE